MTEEASLLLVDDDQHLLQSMAAWLASEGFMVRMASDIATAASAMKAEPADLVLTDLRLGMEDGFDLIAHIAKKHPDTSVLVMTGYAAPSTAVEAVRAGAFDLLTKPLIDDELMLALERALSQKQVQQENETLRRELDRRSGLEHILSHDYRMLKVFDVVDSIADAKASVLITGENGTGKSMIARSIHQRSRRRGGPFVEVACGALPDNLLESELFGHVTGAFTGATTDRAGKFELADGGTLFLDEIATATQAMQVKLLRVLQTYEFEPLGGTETQCVDTRVILATNEDLKKAVANGTFRQDLYYRVNVVNIELPALRERAGDIPLLVDHFIREVSESCDREIDGFDRAAIEKLQAYAWPGNVRQLENVVERAVLLSQDRVLGVEDLPPEVLGMEPSFFTEVADNAFTPTGEAKTVQNMITHPAGQSLKDALEGPEREIILQSLRRHAWNRAATADELDINRTTLYKKMKRLGLDDPRLQYAV
ncbi:MAG: sigma-54 dependent transcriptional regulator [Planctomycetota bacterium]